MKLSIIEQLLADLIGLEPASVGKSTLDRRIEASMAQSGTATMEEYAARLRASEDEIRRLINEVIVAETWFFRDPETFIVLANWVRKWLETAPEGRQLRVLSIGCCTGEEPYSVAMALLDAGVPAERFKVDATDISTRVLEQAANATYSRNSFRTPDLAFRDRYFSWDNKAFRLKDSVKAQVKFSEGNILDGKLTGAAAKYDIIFCRNVLIYFDHASQGRAIANLRALLSPDGILFAGPAESFLVLQSGFTPSREGRGFVPADQRPAQEEPPAKTLRRKQPPAAISPPKPKPAPPSAKVIPMERFKTELTHGTGAGPAETRKNADLEEAARLANQGRLAEAAEICRFYLLETGPSAQAYYLLGLVLDATDRKVEAAASYKKALYLEPEHIESLSQLALLSENMGDLANARRLRERVQRAEKRRAT